MQVSKIVTYIIKWKYKVRSVLKKEDTYQSI